MSNPSSIPDLFWERLSKLVPQSRYAAARASFFEPLRVGFRVNTLRTAVDGSPAAVAQSLEIPGLEPLAWFESGFVGPPESRGTLLERLAEGRIWVQNPSSMFPPVVLRPEPDWELLDLAAAPGSKTLQLACMTGAPDRIAAVEMVRDRFFRLKRNLRAQDAAAVRTYQKDGTKVWRYRPDHFDGVLLDAPCSTEGRFRADEQETYRYWSPRKIKSMARKQRQLLRSAVQCARVGGTVVYATCSFAPEENEAVIADVLRAFPGALAVDPIDVGPAGMLEGLGSWEGESFDPQIRGARRLPPDGTYEAFFVCRLIKTGVTG